MEIWKIACARRQQKAQAPEDEEMEISGGKMVSCDPLLVRKMLFNVSEVIGQLCRCHMLH